jgi:acetoin utilization deacetylase AcuC-like enzyme
MIGPFFYDPRMSLDGVSSYSKSASKPRRFMELMEHHYRTTPVLKPDPITREDLYRVHDRTFVDGVFSGEIANGFGDGDLRVPKACLWTCGAMASAARFAASSRLPVCVPASGFHHAGYAFAEGYCTFNGLMVAAEQMTSLIPGTRVAILDCDMHYGNGTDDIISSLPGMQKKVLHLTSGKHFDMGASPDEFFCWLDESLARINAFRPNLVLYQAGADMSINDPLGGMLTDAQMMDRDMSVFSRLQYPMVWNLAGGYQDGPNMHSNPVLQLHRQTVAATNMTNNARL